MANFEDFLEERRDRQNIQTCSPEDLIFDESIYPRSELDRERVEEFKELTKNGVELPPVEVEKGTNRILDGGHRYTAWKELGEDIKYFETDLGGKSPLLFSAYLNASHGKPLSHEEKKTVAVRLVHSGEDDLSRIADMLGATESVIEKWTKNVRDAMDDTLRDRVKERLAKGDDPLEIAARLEEDKEEVLEIAEDLQEEVEDVLEEADKKQNHQGDWDEEFDESRSKNDTLKCDICGSARIRIMDSDGSKIFRVLENGDTKLESLKEEFSTEQESVSCASCSSSLSTSPSLYHDKCVNLAEFGVGDERNIEEEGQQEQPEADNKDDSTYLSEFGLKPNGTDCWYQGIEVNGNLLYHFSEQGDTVVEFFGDGDFYDIAEYMKRRAIAYKINPERDDIRKWNSEVGDIRYDLAFVDMSEDDSVGVIGEIEADVVAMRFHDMSTLSLEWQESDDLIVSVSHAKQESVEAGNIAKGHYNFILIRGES